jgi:hypothetical protein
MVTQSLPLTVLVYAPGVMIRGTLSVGVLMPVGGVVLSGVIGPTLSEVEFPPPQASRIEIKHALALSCASRFT